MAATQPAASDQGLVISVLRGPGARALLADPAFRLEWDALIARCDWATVFQSPTFVTTWFDIYGDLFEPVLALGRSPVSVLMGAIFLGWDHARQEFVFAGTHHAEYHTFVADRGIDPYRFLQPAFESLAVFRPRHPLRFHFLAPGTPLERMGRRKTRQLRLLSQVQPRPLMELANPELLEASLRKKSNKSRLARLRKLGEVRLIQLHGSGQVQPYLEQIMTWCDLRQGAVNASTPFRSDPRKQNLYVQMLDQHGLMHTTILLVGEQLAAAHLGVINGGTVALGLIVHSPFFAQHSPGKLLILLLGRHLASQGYSAFDLTPGGGYKERFATTSETSFTVQLYWRNSDYLLAQVNACLRRMVKRVLRIVGVSAEQARRFGAVVSRATQGGLWWRLPDALMRRLHEYAWSTVELRFYATPADPPTVNIEGSRRLRRLEIADLLMYEPISGRPEHNAFLALALERLESGQTCYTFAAGGVLLHYCWLDPEECQGVSGFGHAPLRFLAPVGVLWDDFTHPAARRQGLQSESIALRLMELRQRYPGRRAVTGVQAHNRTSWANYERAGFIHAASAWRTFRLGRRSLWVTHEPEAATLIVSDSSDA